MGFFDIFTGRKAPAPGAVRRSAAELRATLLDLNRPTAPFVVRDGGPEDADLVAEWRIVDARWVEIFAKAGLKKAAQVLMRLDDDAGEVRSVDRVFDVEWRAGVPSLSFSAEAFRGQKVEVSWGKGWAFREEDLAFGKVYDWRFDTREIKGPLQDAVTSGGWSWRPVAFGRL